MGQGTIEQALQLGIQHHQAGQLQQAEAIYRKILADQPNNADSLHLLGLISHQQGRHEAAIGLIRRAIVIRSDWPDAYYNLAIALRANQQWEDSITAYKQAISLRPHFAQAHNGLADAYNNLGVLLQNKELFTDAIAAYHKAIESKPNYPEAYANLGIALRQNGKLDEAIAACQQSISLDPHSAIAHDNLGIAQLAKGEVVRAIDSHRHALSLDPSSIESRFNLGNALFAGGSLDDAIESYRAVIQIRPDHAAAHNNLGKLLIDIGQVDEAVAEFGRAVSLKPDNPVYDSAFIFSLYFQSRDEGQAVAEEHFRWGRQHTQPVEQLATLRENHRRLRIGYVSPDFRNHPVGRFLLPLLQNHDHQRFEIFCYSDVAKPDEVTDKLQSAADHWHSTANLKHERLAQKIRADEIDILVDLTGHSTGNRLLVFAATPAPVQVSYLGYPGTTGMRAIKYRLTDHFTDPVGLTEHLHTETLYRLPRTNWCYTEVTKSPAVAPPPFLNRGYVTFGSFNNLAKLTDEMLEAWKKILEQVPNSQLLLKTSAFASLTARSRISRMFSDRVTLLGPQPDHASHLATYGQIDIALDAFPYNGTTTTCDALWMGVPVITLAGHSHISRVGVSLLNSVGLPELISENFKQYVNLAVELAANSTRLSNWRQTLRGRMRHSPLTDGSTFARDMEAAFIHMARQP